MDKVAIVTGASTGIGRAIAITLAKSGFRIILTARRLNELKKTQQLILTSNGIADILICDLTSLKSINSFIKSIKKSTKTLDLLVNVAGVWHGPKELYANKDLETFSQKIILDTYSVGIIAPTLLVHSLLPLMTSKRSIINISGTFESGAKGWLPYYVSKKAIEDLTVGLAEELKSKGIKVYGISPSDVATEEYIRFFPQDAKDALDPSEVARLTLKLALHAGQSGQIWVIKRGQKEKKNFHF